MIYGPVIMILFITTIDIYARYFSNKGEQTAAALETSEQEAPLTPPGALEETEA
jgi:hypothetical protein